MRYLSCWFAETVHTSMCLNSLLPCPLSSNTMCNPIIYPLVLGRYTDKRYNKTLSHSWYITKEIYGTKKNRWLRVINTVKQTWKLRYKSYEFTDVVSWTDKLSCKKLCRVNIKGKVKSKRPVHGVSLKQTMSHFNAFHKGWVTLEYLVYLESQPAYTAIIET